MSYLVGIDIGGTFTDCAIVDAAGKLLTTKVPSTPADFARGMLDALGAGAEALGVSLDDFCRDIDYLSHGTTVGTNTMDWHLPTNVAYRFTPGEQIMVQIHYVNALTQVTPTKGKVVMDLYRSQLTTPIEMGTLFATQQSIRICRSNPNPTYSGACSFKNGGVTIAAANGHFHSRGNLFEMMPVDEQGTLD